LPGEERSAIARQLDLLCREQPPITLSATGLLPLGYGVAVAITSPELVTVRQILQREWSHWLSPQDQQRFQPHVTIQNKASPEVARATRAELAAVFAPFSVRGEGLQLWHYRGGPWELARRFRFTG
jgi:2'-5' RNA ligase